MICLVLLFQIVLQGVCVSVFYSSGKPADSHYHKNIYTTYMTGKTLDKNALKY